MSEAIEEIKGKKSRREKAMEAWAATIYADHAKPGPAGGRDLKAEGTGGSSFRKELIKKPDPLRQVKAEPKVQVVRDTVESVNSSPEARVQDQMEAARKLVTSRPQATTPPPVQNQSPTPAQPAEAAQTVEQASEVVEAAQQEALQEVTPEEVQTVSLAVTGGTPASKKTEKAQKAEQEQASAPEEDSEADDSIRQLIKPGNSPKAKAYVRVSDLPSHQGGQGLEDFLLAL